MNPSIKASIGLFLIFGLLIVGCTSGQAPEPSTPPLPPTSTITPTLSPTPSQTATLTPAPTATLTPTPVPTLIGGYPGRYLLTVPEGDKQFLNLYGADGELIETLFTYPFPFDPNDNYLDYSEVKWSPTGKTIAIMYYHDGGYLVLLRSDGTEIITIKAGIHFYGGYTGQINWSPDGQWLVFPSYGDNSYVDIYIIDANGENLQQLTNNYGEDSSPFFMPKGKEIMYSGENDGRIMNVDGSDLRTTDYAYRWTQDEQHNLYSDYLGKILYLRNVITGETMRVYSVNGQNRYIGDYFFSPDEQSIFVEEYSSWHDVPPSLYRIDRDKLEQPELFAVSNNFEISYDQSALLLSGWLASEEVYGEPKFYAVDFDGTRTVPLSSQAARLFMGIWQPGSQPDQLLDTMSFLGPTPIPSWAAYPDPPILESFDDVEIDPTLWQWKYADDVDKYSFSSIDGGLNIQSKAKLNQEGLELEMKQAQDITSLNSFAAKLELWTGSYGASSTKIKISANIHGLAWWTECQVGLIDNASVYVCGVYSLEDNLKDLEYRTRFIPVQKNTWYEARIDLSPDSGAVQFYLDGELIGTYLPKDANQLMDGVHLHPSVGVWSEDGMINASFDDIRLGAVQARP